MYTYLLCIKLYRYDDTSVLQRVIRQKEYLGIRNCIRYSFCFKHINNNWSHRYTF